MVCYVVDDDVVVLVVDVLVVGLVGEVYVFECDV